MLLGVEGSVASETLGCRAMQIGDLDHGLGCFGCGGEFLHELLVGRDGRRGVGPVVLRLSDAVVGEEDFFVLRIVFGESAHEAHHFIAVLRRAGELSALEVSEGRGLAFREFVGHLGQHRDAFIVAAEGEQSRRLGVERARGELARGVFLHERVDERQRAFVVSFLLRADGDPEFGLLDLRGLRIFRRHFLVGGDGLVPLALLLEHIADAKLRHGGDSGRRIGGEEIPVGFERALHIALLRARGGFVDHGQAEQRTLRIKLGRLLEKLRGFLRVPHGLVGVG